jgi:adenylate kinase
MKQVVSQPITIILLGDIAAGKGTHAAFLKKQYRCIELDMGRELRALKMRNAKVAKQLAGSSDKGKLAQTSIVREILHDFIAAAPPTKGLLFNGNPKMVGEARLTKKWLSEAGRDPNRTIVLYLKITKTETIKRMTGRSIAENRADDNLQALENRLIYYRINITAVCEYFKRHFTFRTVSSMGDIATVEKNLEQPINAFIHSQNPTGNRAYPRKR